jgi:hypothetical protein
MIGGQECGEVFAQVIATFVVVAFDGRFFEGPVHSFDLPVRPGMVGFGETVFDAVFATPHGEHVRHVSRRRPIAVPGQIGELNAVVGQHRMDFIGDRLDQSFEERRRGQSIGFSFEPGERDLDVRSIATKR